MRNVKYLLIGVASIVFVSAGNAQEWGPMQRLNLGDFNPSFCDAESLLYLDSYFRFLPDLYTPIIYTSHLYRIEDGHYFWSGRVQAPYPINLEGSYSATPFISSAGDSLFFSSDRPGTRGGMDIWLTIRIEGEWTEPVNLGDSVNTEADELGPCFATQFGILFFDRHQYGSDEFNKNKILKSELIDGVYQSPEILPQIINVPSYYTYGPFYDEYESALYFTNYGGGQVDYPLKKSLYVDDQWQTPQPLSDNVNRNPYHIGWVTTENAFISQDRTVLFYDKLHISIDHWSELFLSLRLGSSVENERNSDLPIIKTIDVYPNPSNTSFNIDLSSFNESGKLKIYNIRGQLIKKFDIDQNTHTILWNTSDNNKQTLAAGVYFAVLEHGKNKVAKKMILLK